MKYQFYIYEYRSNGSGKGSGKMLPLLYRVNENDVVEFYSGNIWQGSFEFKSKEQFLSNSQPLKQISQKEVMMKLLE